MGPVGRQLTALGLHHRAARRRRPRRAAGPPRRQPARWAPTASILVVNPCHRYVEDTDWDFSEFSIYDLGQAVAHMTIQPSPWACSHDSSGPSTSRARGRVDVPEHWQVTTMSAFGRLPAAVGTQPLITADNGQSRQWR